MGAASGGARQWLSSGAAPRSRSSAAQGVSSGAGHVLALDDIDLSIAPGEFLCIVGPTGCGKSTLLRILAGLDTQTGGTLTIEAPGWPVENAMVFQDSGLFPWMSVENNVALRPDDARRAGAPRRPSASRPRSSSSG